MATTFWAKCFFLFTIGNSILLFVAINLYDIGEFKLMRRLKNSSQPPTNDHFMMKDRINMNARKPVTLEAGTRTVVLVYTVFFGRRKWIGGRDRCGFETKFSFTAKKCLSGDFELTYDKHRFQESDLVVFHARNMPAIGHLRKLLKRRPTSQRWVYASWESPDATPNPAPFNGLFNLTWTYRSDSDFLSPYGSYEELSDEERIDKMKYIPDYSQGKTELVAWMVSHCSAQPRMTFVQELNEHIKVDVFGKCSKHFGEKKRCPTPPTDCLKKFKFYLSFENALCEDYITEKYWGRLGEDINVIPVVMGGANYAKLVIPGSYINVMDFKTVKQLADYLHYLDKNNTAYNEYFKWRVKYKVFRDNLDLTLCQICKWCVSKTPLEPKVYGDLVTHWVGKGRCHEKNHLITNMWKT